VSRETDLPLTWDREENIIWKVPLPEKSGATPIVWKDRIFLNVASGKEIWLWCLERNEGKVLWKRLLDDRNEDKRKGNMSSPSPVTDGQTVWIMTGTGILTAFDFSGRQLWQRRLQREYGSFGILHGYSSSPLLWGDSLFVQVLHGFYTDDPSYVLAIDKQSGETRWRVERPTDAPREAPDAYTTPALLMNNGKPEIVVSGGDYVTGHDPETGREIWRVGGLNPTRNPMQRIVASPVVVGEMLFVPSRVKPLLALKAGGRSAGESPRVIWSMDRGPDVPTPAIDGRYAYLLTDGGIVWCLDAASGEVVWGPERVRSGTYSASPLVADGKIYVTNEQGETTVLQGGPAFKKLAENEVGEYTLSSLAISEGRIYLRTAEHLWAIGL
jgi:outer membrane protein assembly factor BamB